MLLFAILAAIAVVSGIFMIVQDNPVRSALYLVVVLFCVALLYLSLNAAFIAAVQIVVYAGAIMVLFIFVIMLLNLSVPDRTPDRLAIQKYVSIGLFIALVSILAGVIAVMPTGYRHGHLGQGLSETSGTGLSLGQGLVGAREIGIALFDPSKVWLLPFEVISILLLVAAVGAIMLAKKRI